MAIIDESVTSFPVSFLILFQDPEFTMVSPLSTSGTSLQYADLLKYKFYKIIKRKGTQGSLVFSAMLIHSKWFGCL